MQETTGDISKIISQINPNDSDVTWCPARIVRRRRNYFLGTYGNKGAEYFCDITGEDCPYVGLLFKDEMVTKEWVCLTDYPKPNETPEKNLFPLSLPQIKSYLLLKTQRTVPKVRTFIERKKHIPYDIYAKLRGKIER